MLTLFLFICIIYIGLGLPDSILGSAWPAIYPDLNLPVSNMNYITMLISLGTVLASLFSARLINKFGTAKVTFFSTLLTTLAMLGFSFSNSMVWFLCLAIPAGIGAGAIDAALNNFVAVHYNSTYMSFLHCFYGVGVAVSPFVMALALSFNNDWRLGYRIVFIAMSVISILSAISLPLWKRAKPKSTEKEELKGTSLSLIKMAKMPAVRISWLVFFFSVALEFTCGIWGCTYLVSAEGLSESLSAKLLTLYYVGMTAGRFVSGLLNKKLNCKTIVYLGYTLTGVGIALIALPIPPVIKGVALLLIGFGNGPTFPNMIYLTPVNFGREISQSITGTQMACCNLGILLMPPVFGFIAQYVGLNAFPYYIIALFLIMVFSTLIYNKRAKKLTNKEI